MGQGSPRWRPRTRSRPFTMCASVRTGMPFATTPPSPAAARWAARRPRPSNYIASHVDGHRCLCGSQVSVYEAPPCGGLQPVLSFIDDDVRRCARPCGVPCCSHSEARPGPAFPPFLATDGGGLLRAGVAVALARAARSHRRRRRARINQRSQLPHAQAVPGATACRPREPRDCACYPSRRSSFPATATPSTRSAHTHCAPRCCFLARRTSPSGCGTFGPPRASPSSPATAATATRCSALCVARWGYGPSAPCAHNRPAAATSSGRAPQRRPLCLQRDGQHSAGVVAAGAERGGGDRGVGVLA